MKPFAPLTLVLALFLAGCAEEKPDEQDTSPDPNADEDGDGSAASEDCDDGDATRHPGADELCNDLDDDCDGAADEEAVDRQTLYADVDGDGAGDPDAVTETCDTPSGYVTTGDDCDDTNGAINPSATEVCDAADVDENCNGTADDADATVDATTGSTWYTDADGDGHGDPAASVVACDVPDGAVETADDCDDTNGAISPSAAEVCDAADVDEDCSGAADDADANVDPDTLAVWYEDLDGDGYGDAASTTSACDEPSGFLADATDCDPTRADVNPSALEACDDADADEDCDGAADNADPGALGEATWYADADGDGHGDPGMSMDACDVPEGYVARASDCDDAAVAVYPGAPEQCDGMANDCDTSGAWTADAELGVASWVDADGAWTAVTDTLAAGTADAPVAWAASDDGDLNVCAGTWYVQLDGSGYDVVVAGAGSGLTVLDGGGTDTVIRSTGGALTLSGVTLQNGAGTDGGGLYCLATDLVLEDVAVTDSTATSEGGGLFLQSCADAALTNVTVTGNLAQSGGGLYVTNSDGIVIDSLVVEGNVATTSGGGVTFSNSDFTLSNATISANAAGASYSGGGLAVTSASGTLDTVSITDNEAGTAAGILGSVATLDIVGGEVSGNLSTSYGAALYGYYTSTIAATGTTFSGNLAGSGAPILLDTNVTATFDTCTFSGNEGATAGVLAFAATASATVTASDFSDNTPNDAYAAGTAYTFGLAASATCDDATGCY